jgi:HD-GYP domain-containing protein (c-di-GMP phosphodiesterase class II)
MSQIILIEDNNSLIELLTLNLGTYVGAEVIPRGSAEDAISILSILPNIGLVIAKNKIGAEETSKLIAKFIKETNREIGFIVLGEAPEEAKDISIEIQNSHDWEKVIQASAKELGINAQVLAKKILPDYIPVSLRYFLPLDNVCCDVFIRIKKGPGEFQFVKRIHAGDTFSKTMIKKYLEQGLKEFFIPRDMQKNFTNFVSDHLVKRLDAPDLSPEETLEVISHGYDIAIKEIKKLGFTSATIQLTEGLIKGIIKITKTSPEMSGLLHKVINSKTGQLYQHSHMCAIVAAETLKNLGLDTPQNIQKMTYASFFKDIALADKEELLKISTFEELESSELGEEDWDLVFNHALEGAVMIRKHPEAPLGVDELIKHHHGSQNGKGFSSAQTIKLPNLSQVLIVANEFVKELMVYKEQGGRPTPIVDVLYKRYPHPELIIIIKALEKTLRKSKLRTGITGPTTDEPSIES